MPLVLALLVLPAFASASPVPDVEATYTAAVSDCRFHFRLDKVTQPDGSVQPRLVGAVEGLACAERLHVSSCEPEGTVATGLRCTFGIYPLEIDGTGSDAAGAYDVEIRLQGYAPRQATAVVPG